MHKKEVVLSPISYTKS